MSFAIIRNTKYKRENLKGIYRHNERRNKNYSNDNIDKEKSYLNYSLKSPKYRYDKEFDMMKEKYNLKGQIKTVSNIACEYIITSDKQFFETQVDNIKAEYQQKEDNLEWKYEYRINKLEKENGYLHKVIDKFRETIHKFIEWICVNFDMGTGDTLIRDFEKETRTYLDAEEQIKREEREKDLEMER